MINLHTWLNGDILYAEPLNKNFVDVSDVEIHILKNIEVSKDSFVTTKGIILNENTSIPFNNVQYSEAPQINLVNIVPDISSMLSETMVPNTNTIRQFWSRTSGVGVLIDISTTENNITAEIVLNNIPLSFDESGLTYNVTWCHISGANEYYLVGFYVLSGSGGSIRIGTSVREINTHTETANYNTQLYTSNFRHSLNLEPKYKIENDTDILIAFVCTNGWSSTSSENDLKFILRRMTNTTTGSNIRTIEPKDTGVSEYIAFFLGEGKILYSWTDRDNSFPRIFSNRMITSDNIIVASLSSANNGRTYYNYGNFMFINYGNSTDGWNEVYLLYKDGTHYHDSTRFFTGSGYYNTPVFYPKLNKIYGYVRTRGTNPSVVYVSDGTSPLTRYTDSALPAGGDISQTIESPPTWHYKTYQDEHCIYRDGTIWYNVNNVTTLSNEYIITEPLEDVSLIASIEAFRGTYGYELGFSDKVNLSTEIYDGTDWIDVPNYKYVILDNKNVSRIRFKTEPCKVGISSTATKILIPYKGGI